MLSSAAMTVFAEKSWPALHTRLQAFIRARVEDAHTADDLLQATLLRIHDRIDSVRDSQKLEPWAYQIARNLIVDHYRQRRPQEEVPEELAASAGDGAEDPRRTVAGWLEKMLEELPEMYREPVRLNELEGMTLQEIARKLDLSLPAVKSRVLRGRAKLKEILLACCHIELDRNGAVIDYQHRHSCCLGGKSPPDR